MIAEDVGRHNAVDKVKGEALLKGIPTVDRILLSTGRVSSEMLLKAARMGVPVVASRTSPTEMAVGLAEQLGITVIGYLRPDGLNLYAGDALDRAIDAMPDYSALMADWQALLARRAALAESLRFWTAILEGWAGLEAARRARAARVRPREECRERWEARACRLLADADPEIPADRSRSWWGR